jgi:hypothetical protein
LFLIIKQSLNNDYLIVKDKDKDKDKNKDKDRTIVVPVDNSGTWREGRDGRGAR